MSRRRELTGIANAVAGSFASRNNDFNGYWAVGQLYCRAMECGSLQVVIRLLPPDESNPCELIASVGEAYRTFLLAHLNRRGLPVSWVASATVEVQFESATPMPEFLRAYAGRQPFQCQVVLVDDLARERKATSSSWCSPHDPTRETQSTRAK